jgi:hypothetical protein
MAQRNIKRDYDEIVKFSTNYIDKTTLECIEAYATKRKIISHRAGKAFWNNVDDGNIKVELINGLYYIRG